jgi:hypothetical protein
MPRRVASLALSAALLSVIVAFGQETANDTAATIQSQREAALASMLRGATLEGSFTMTGPGRDATQLSREKYTLGDVKKLDGNLWLIPTRIQYGDKDLQVPITLPIEWAGDTPVVVVDNVGIPGLGAVSARVMFFADHYAGYWQHGPASGNLFGTIHRAKAAHRDKTAPAAAGDSAD